MLNDGVTPGSVVKNVITRYITTTQGTTNGWGSVSDPNDSGVTLRNGKRYEIKLHIGLNSVEFDASVLDWVPAQGGEVDLPHNN